MKTITIAICDSDPMALAIISGAVRAVFDSNGVSPRIQTFTSAAKMREELGKKEVQLIMTDIEMPQLDGIQFARQLRAQGSRADIIFVTGSEDRVFEAFEVHPFGFVRKGNFLKDLSDVVSRYIRSKQMEGASQEMDLPTRSSGRIHISVAEILYFEGNGMYQRLFLLNGKQEQIASRMDHLEKSLLEQGFLRIHKGYLVNYRYITRLDRCEATLVDGKKIPISRRRCREIQEQYLQLGKDQGALLF